MSGDNYVCTLNQSSVKKAREELNEIPEDRLAAVQSFRDWIDAQPHIKCPKTDTLLLLCFLRTAKFSQIKAREKFQHYLNLRTTLPKTYPDLDPTENAVKEIITSGYMFPLPKPDKDGRTIIFSRMEDAAKLWSKHGVKMMSRTGILLMEYLNRSESNQVNGLVIICDFGGLNSGLVTKMMTAETGRMKKELLKAMPGRYKAMHYYRAGLIIDTMISFMRPFVPKKLIDRIKTHNTMESIYEFVPKECLPLEYLPDDYTGPNVGEMKDCINTYLNAITQKEFCDDIKYRSSSAFGIDESKRPAEVVTEHFRKLHVD